MGSVLENPQPYLGSLLGKRNPIWVLGFQQRNSHRVLGSRKWNQKLILLTLRGVGVPSSLEFLSSGTQRLLKLSFSILRHNETLIRASLPFRKKLLWVPGSQERNQKLILLTLRNLRVPRFLKIYSFGTERVLKLGFFYCKAQWDVHKPFCCLLHESCSAFGFHGTRNSRWIPCTRKWNPICVLLPRTEPYLGSGFPRAESRSGAGFREQNQKPTRLRLRGVMVPRSFHVSMHRNRIGVKIVFFFLF